MQSALSLSSPLSLVAQKSPKKSLSFPFSSSEEVSEFISKHKFSILNSNVRSLHKHLTNVRDLTKTFNTTFVVLTEIWQVDSKYYTLDNYHEAQMKVRQTKRGGGICIFCSTKLPKPEPFTPLDKNYKSLECTAIITKYDHVDLIIVAIYKQPKSLFKEFLKELRSIFQILENSNKRFVLAGDMNVNVLDKNSNSIDYIDLIDEFHFKQIVSGPTRITKDSNTNLDHIITNIDYISAKVSDECIADHQAVVAVWKKCKGNEKYIQSKSRKSTKILDFESTVTNIIRTDWEKWRTENYFENIDKMYDSFNKLLSECMVYKEPKHSRNSPKKPWISKELLNHKKIVDKKRKLFLKKQNDETELDFKNERKLYNKCLKEAEHRYFADKLEVAGKNPKKIWSIINELLSRQRKHTKLTKMIFNGKEYSGDLEIANLFNEHFKEIPFKISQKIPDDLDFKKFMNKSKECTEKMVFKPTTVLDTYNSIQSLKSKHSTGFDLISSKLLKKCNLTLCHPITAIINRSFEENQFPNGLKVSKITPLYKKNDKMDPNNFRPIGQNSIISTIIEKSAKAQMNKHSIEYSTISKYQFGYRHSHGTIHPLLVSRALIEQELEASKFVILCTFDQEKAFDLLENQVILPEKYNHFGIGKNAISWLKSFFTSRKQFVNFNGENSSIIQLHNIGCSQGSTLGPGSAYNYICNDLPNVCDNCEGTLMFCDDNNYIYSSADPESLNTIVNTELAKVMEYMKANKLSVSISKCKYLVFKPKRKSKSFDFEVKIDDKILEEVSELRFLGVVMNNKNTYKSHIEEVMRKVRSGISALKLSRNLLNYRAKFMIFNSMINSHINYCSLVWHDKMNKTQFSTLEKLQKKAIRILFSARYNVHTAKLFEISKIIPLSDIYNKESILFIKKLQNNELPEIFKDIIGNPASIFDDSKRRPKQKFSVKIPHRYKKGNAIYNILTEWNNSELSIRSPSKTIETKIELKTKIQKRLINFECERSNCYMCSIDRFRDYHKYVEQ